MTKNITSEESSRTYHPHIFYKGIEEPRQITVTTYCSDNSGNPVKESDPTFTHYEATWAEANRKDVHKRIGLEYMQCLSFEEAYEKARQVIQEDLWKKLGPEYSIKD
jgi:hypothetical protein